MSETLSIPPNFWELAGPAWLNSEAKRYIDLTLAGMLLVPLGAAALTAAGLIALTEREQPFLSQDRVGQRGETLKIWKIRSMPHGTEETMSNGHYDHRRTKIGRVISATRIDETPQLYNVLNGSMSMVGIRPLVKAHHDEFLASIQSLDEDPALITDSYLKGLHEQGFKLTDLAQQAEETAPKGWFDPYGIYLYVQGKTDTHEARLVSNIRYAFDEASLTHDLHIIGSALGIVKNLRHPEIVLPDHNPEPIHSHPGA